MAPAHSSDAVAHGSSILVMILLALWPCAVLALDGSTSQDANRQSSKSSSLDVYWFPSTADRFANFAKLNKDAVDAFHQQEQDRLEAAISNADTENDKSLLEVTAIVNEESRLAAQNAFNEMTNFVSTLKASMGATGNVASCQDLTCGNHALCRVSPTTGASCQCEEGYEGNGFVCNSPSMFRITNFLGFLSGMSALQAEQANAMQIADINVATLSGNRVIVAYRSLDKNHKGYVVSGEATREGIRWGMSALFSGQSAAFSPVLSELTDKDGFAISYRDDNRGGSGLLARGWVDPNTNEVHTGVAKVFARHQAQQTQMLPMPGSRVVVLYSEHALGGSGKRLLGGAMYGSAVLAQLNQNDAPEILGKYRFHLGPVARLDATLLSPTSFVVAYRGGTAANGQQKAEASVMFGQLHGSEIAFDPHPVSLEPNQGEIWARSVISLRDNYFAYTYHSGLEQTTKQALLRWQPDKHRLEVVQSPQVIARGFTPFIKTVGSSLIQQDDKPQRVMPQRGPKMVTYYNKEGSAKTTAQMCHLDITDNLTCKDIMTSDVEIVSLGGAPVGDGRTVMVFSDAKGTPSFHLVGMLDADEL